MCPVVVRLLRKEELCAYGVLLDSSQSKKSLRNGGRRTVTGETGDLVMKNWCSTEQMVRKIECEKYPQMGTAESNWIN